MKFHASSASASVISEGEPDVSAALTVVNEFFMKNPNELLCELSECIDYENRVIVGYITNPNYADVIAWTHRIVAIHKQKKKEKTTE